MRTYLILAEGASEHFDGPMTLFRAGVNQILGNQNGPTTFRGTLVLLGQVTDATDRGSHTINVKSVNAENKEFAGGITEFTHQMTLGGNGNFNFILNFAMQFPVLGEYAFVVKFGADELRWPVKLLATLEKTR